MEHRLYSVAQIRALEQAAGASVAAGELMQRAGRAAASLALDLVRDQAKGQASGPVLVLAGPGNNGGDALELAANLCDAGLDVVVLHLAGGGKPSAAAAQALARARNSGANFADVAPDVRNWALVVDGLFGIGLDRPLDGRYRELVLALDSVRCPVLALDVPSGLDADSGAIVGASAGVAVHASHTITFIGDKPGLHTGAGCEHAGAVVVAQLEVELEAAGPVQACIGAPALFRPWLAPRRANAHKGHFGDVAIVGGAHGMLGAVVLAARGALYAGAGRVFAATLDTRLALLPQQPEIMCRLAHDFDLAGRVLVLGPGMGGAMEAMRVLGAGIDSAGAVVVDADGLNLVAASLDLQARLAARGAPTILTPHPLEAARLLGVDVAEVQANRVQAARSLARRFQAVVVLKGAGSVVARPDAMLAINPTGNPGLATGGSGDVLAGVCGALLGQGWPAWEAAVGAVWMHGAAADRLVAAGDGPIGITAGELPLAVRSVLNALVRDAGITRT